MYFDFLYNFVTFLIPKRIQRSIVIEDMAFCNVPLYFCHILIKPQFSRQIFEKKFKYKILMKILPVGAELFNANRTHRHDEANI
jgi:hypothetical protein